MSNTTTTTVAFRIPKSIAKQVEEMAVNAGMNQSEWVRHLVLQALHATSEPQLTSVPELASPAKPTASQPVASKKDLSRSAEPSSHRDAENRTRALAVAEQIANAFRKAWPDSRDWPDLTVSDEMSIDELLKRNRDNIAFYKAKTDDEFARQMADRLRTALEIFERTSKSIRHHCPDASQWPDITVPENPSFDDMCDRCKANQLWLRDFLKTAQQ